MDLFNRHKFFKAMSVEFKWDLKEPQRPKKGASAEVMKKYKERYDKWKAGKAAAVAAHEAEVARDQLEFEESLRRREQEITSEAPGVGKRWINDGRGGYYEYFAWDGPGPDDRR